MKASADIIGTNCGNGCERMINIVKAIRKIVNFITTARDGKLA